MAERILGEEGTRRRRRFRFLLLPLVIAALLALLLAGSARAVHDLQFQLDGDVSTHAYTVPDAGVQVFDWGQNTAAGSAAGSDTAHSLFSVTTGGGIQTVSNVAANVGAGKPFAAASFVRDFRSGASCTLDSALSSSSTTVCTNDSSTYATGSKDTLGIGNGGWQCNTDNNVNSKIDIVNAYTASYFTGANQTGDHIIYFGLEKNKNNGTNDVGIWLLQGSASCSSAGATNFTGQHQNKDVLVVSEFTQGGGVSTIKAFQWAAAASGQFAGDGGCIDSNGNPNPATGGCNNLPIGSGADCKTTSSTGTHPVDSLCATTNASCTTAGLPCNLPWNQTLFTPWLTWDATLGIGNRVVSPDFFEGAIDVTKVFGAAGGGAAPSCFNTVVPDTRSSASPTATLFDFVTNQIGECQSSTSTQPVDATDTSLPPGSSIPVDPANAAVSVKDKTVITVSGLGSFSGSISWHICGRTDPSSTATCDSGGVDLGSQNITTGGTYYSPTATITAAGRYCFRAEFSATTTGVPPSSDHSSGECLTIAPVTPTISTAAVASPVDFGQPVSDNATLSGTAHAPGTGGLTGATPAGSINPSTLGGDATGLITFTLYKSDCTTLATGTGSNPQTVAVTGDGAYGPVSFTPDAPGTYYWDATYPGDSPNTNAATNLTACPSNAEKVIVQQIPTSLKTKQDWIPNDTATVTASAGNLVAGGSVRFRLYASSNCSTTALYDESVSVPGGSSSAEVNTHNTGIGAGMLRINTAYTDAAGSIKGPYSWSVQYTPAAVDTAHLPSSSACNAENFSITYKNDAGP